MPEYIYAIHDFVPENDDEIPFKAGERIEVVEKDDQYGDGWWQGRNLAGRIGLFPQSYTSASDPAPAVRTPTGSSLQPLQEETPEETAKLASNDGAVMAATLTDVQEAIEQLGIRGDNDAARSFSFVSSTRDGETDKENETDDDETDGWHKNTRTTLAERAKKENARKQREEAEENARPRHASVPPIPVELSDESDAEDEEEPLRNAPLDVHPDHHKYSNASGPISPPDSAPVPEPLQPAISLVSDPSPAPPPPPPPSQEVTVASTPEPVQRTTTPHTPTTATAPRFSQSSESKTDTTSSINFHVPSARSSANTSVAAGVPLPKSPSTSRIGTPSSKARSMTPPQPLAPIPVPSATPTPPPTVVPIPAPVPVPAPAPVLVPAPVPIPVPAPAPVSGLPSTYTPVSAPATVSDPSMSPADTAVSLNQTHPSEWSVEQVVAWLRTKNVDESTCAKFIEHEITGDVLLELDVNLLKELDITAFGKRMRIANAIVELRRPASFASEQQLIQTASNGYNASPGAPAMGVTSVESSPAYPADSPASPPQHIHVASFTSSEAPRVVGLGIATTQASRPAQLVLSSPSDGALQPKTIIVKEEPILETGDDAMQDPRGVQSETEAPPSSARRRFLGRSNESGSSKDSPLSSPLPTDEMGVARRHTRGKRSIDGSVKGAGDRLSFFSSMGKSRKPPPRYSIYDNETSPTQNGSERSKGITRLYLGGKKSGRPSTAGGRKDKEDGSYNKEKGREGDFEQGHDKERRASDGSTREATLLRKRHVSQSSHGGGPFPTGTAPSALPGVRVMLQPGEYALDKIGTPDHAGWLHKKGERYNTWKLRYMVLRGPHLYYLRSNSRTETKIKGYIKVQGYKVIADENANPGKYGFRIVHDKEPSHFFSSDEQMVVREWMKALMKATIDRDFSRPVISSVNIPTIPLAVAQAMSPTPRPPSPTARAATQKALRRENPNQLSSRDARVLMGLPAPDNGVLPPNADQARLESFFIHEPKQYDLQSPTLQAPPRPARDSRIPNGKPDREVTREEREIVDWANAVLPEHYHIQDITTDLSSGLIILRLAENLKGKACEPPIADSVFARGNSLEGMFKLFDFLLDHDVKLGSVSINDIKNGNPEKTLSLLRSLRSWGERRQKGVPQSGPWAVVEPAIPGNW